MLEVTCYKDPAAVKFIQTEKSLLSASLLLGIFIMQCNVCHSHFVAAFNPGFWTWP